MFRKRQAATPSEDDSISDDLLAAIPDLDGPEAAAAAQPEPLAAAFGEKKDTPWDDVAFEAVADAKPEPYAWNQPATGGRVKNQASKNKGAMAPTDPSPEVHALVAEVRKQMEQVVNRELGKVEDTFANTLQQMNDRLHKSQSEIDHLKEANESLLRAKIDYERKIDALKQLTKTIGDL